MMRLYMLVSLCFAGNLFAQDSEALYQAGLALKQSGKIVEAAEAFSQSAVVAEDNSTAKYELAWCYNEQRNYRKALQTLLPLQKKMKAFAKYHFEIGLAYENLKVYDSAITSYMECLNVNPAYNNAWYSIAYCIVKQDKAANAIPFYQAELALNNEFKEPVLLDLAFTYATVKIADSAIKYYNEAIAFNPKNYMPYNGLAQVYKQLNADTLKAIEIYKQAIQLQPKERKAMFEIGQCYAQMGKLSQAISYLKTALAVEKDYADAFTLLGKVFYWQHDYTQAVLLLERSLQANAKDIKLPEYLLDIYMFKKQKAAAINMYNKLKELGYENLADLKYKMDRVNWPR